MGSKFRRVATRREELVMTAELGIAATFSDVTVSEEEVKWLDDTTGGELVGPLVEKLEALYQEHKKANDANKLLEALTAKLPPRSTWNSGGVRTVELGSRDSIHPNRY